MNPEVSHAVPDGERPGLSNFCPNTTPAPTSDSCRGVVGNITYNLSLFVCSSLTSLSTFFQSYHGVVWLRHAHFYSPASLKCHAPDTWHDTKPSHIILTSPSSTPVSLSSRGRATSTILTTLVCHSPGSNPWPPVPRSRHSTEWATGAGTHHYISNKCNN